MIKNLKYLLLGILLLVLVLPSFSTGQGEQGEETVEKKGTIRLWVGWSLLMEVFEQVEQDYEGENPEVDLEIAAFNLRDFEQKLAISIPAGQAPEVFVTSEYIIPQYVQSGYIAKPPQNIVEFVETKYDPLVRSVNMFQGPDDAKPQIYGVPHIGIARVLYYNKKIFRESGVPVRAPETWDELFDFAKKSARYDSQGKLERGGISLRLFGGGSGITEKFTIKLVQAGGTLLGQTADGGWAANFNNQAGVDALRFYIDALYKYKVDSLEIKHDSEAFMNGQTAMYQRELWPIPVYKSTAPNLEFGTSVMPSYKERGTAYSTESAFVPKSAKNKALAWDVIKYFNQPGYLKMWFETQGWVPPRIDIDFSDIFAKMPEYKAAFDFPEGYLLALYPPILPVDEIYTKFAERVSQTFQDPSLVENEAGIKRVLEEAAEEVNAILKENDLYGEGKVTKPTWAKAPRDLGYKF